MVNNEVSGWRHTLYATQADIVAMENEVTEFHGEALVVKEPTQLNHVSNDTSSRAECSPPLLALVDSLLEVRDQILGFLKSDGNSGETRRNHASFVRFLHASKLGRTSTYV